MIDAIKSFGAMVVLILYLTAPVWLPPMIERLDATMWIPHPWELEFPEKETDQ